MAKAKKPEYPKRLFFFRAYPDTTNEYSQTVISLQKLAVDVDETVFVGLYELKKVVKVANQTILEE